LADTPEAFLLEDYKQKISYLTSHLQRMWTRFNFFVTLEAALLGGKVLLVPDKPSPMVGIAGMILSVVWYMMGAQDRFLADFYRWQIKEAAGRVKQVVSKPDKTDGNGSEADRLHAARQIELARNAATEYVGTVEDELVEKYKRGKERKLGCITYFLRGSLAELCWAFCRYASNTQSKVPLYFAHRSASI
jgi:hypothetical protein